MYSFLLEFDSEQEAQEVARRLWDKLNFSGEMGIKPLGAGRWLLELNSEKEIKEGIINRLRAGNF